MVEDERSLDATINLLIVDRSSDAIRSIEEAFADGSVAHAVHAVTDGEGALDFVHRRGEYEDAPRPDLILLDLPEVGGDDVLTEIKGDPTLRRIPVIVLTTSDAEADIAKSYDLAANAFIQKPADPDDFATVARAIEDFWLTLVTLPSTE